MADALAEQIVQSVMTRLATITTANGYQQDLTADRVRFNGSQPGNNKVFVHAQGLTRVDDFDPPGNEQGAQNQWHLNLAIEAFAQEKDDSATPIDQRLQRIAADIYKALMVDPSHGGLAERTILGDIELVLFSKPPAVVLQPSIHFLADRTNMFIY